jgi:hypothetical protein
MSNNNNNNNDKEQPVLFGDLVFKEPWETSWEGMPEYVTERKDPFAMINIRVSSQEALDDLSLKLEQKLNRQTKAIWHPKLICNDLASLCYHNKKTTLLCNPQYPVYIVSKGRADSRLTSKALCAMKVPHYIVVEAQERTEYFLAVDHEFVTLLTLPDKFLEEYETCDEDSHLSHYERSKGPGAARNFVWDHSLKNGFKRHWVMDDNISCFHRLNNNLKIKVTSGTILRCAEDFVDRYSNVPIAGLNYSWFAKANDKLPPYITNTRIYSILLIENDIPYRWRGRYNEDTDLSLRVLKDGLCTIQFNAFLADKATTQALSGGNTEAFYEHEGTMNKSQMLEDMHPDVAKVVHKFGRWHHHVDYRPFRANELKLVDGIEIEGEVDNYGMDLVAIKDLQDPEKPPSVKAVHKVAETFRKVANKIDPEDDFKEDEVCSSDNGSEEWQEEITSEEIDQSVDEEVEFSQDPSGQFSFFDQGRRPE